MKISTYAKTRAAVEGRTLLGVVAAGLALVGVGGVLVYRRAEPPAATVAAVTERGPVRPKAVAGSGGGAELKQEQETPVPVAAPVERFDLSQLGAPTEGARRMVQGIWSRGGATGPMTPEEVAAWQENMDRIVAAGSDSVAALAEYLRGDQDTFFSAEDSQQLGFRSAREAAIEALAHVGGPVSTAVMNEALELTASPREVALLARGLEEAAPGQYREQALAAVRESLAMAAEKQLGGLDVAPLFEVLQTYGGPEVAADLERAAGQWGQYATLALAELPDGAGVPSLLRMATVAPDRRPHAARLQALQVAAQLASSNDVVRAALVEQARENRIAPYLWPYLARPLSGEQAGLQNAVLQARPAATDDTRTGTVHIAGTNQNLVWARAGEGMTAEQITRQAALIAELRAATTNPDGRRVLDQAKALLEQQQHAAAAAQGGTPNSPGAPDAVR